MSSKFSQGNGVQKLPPVCRAPLILPPGWIAPPHPKLVSYLEWEVKRYDDSIANHKVIYLLEWVPAEDWWAGGDFSGPWIVQTTVGPVTANQPVPITTRVDTVLAPVMITAWQGPEYFPSRPWKSGQETNYFPAHPGHVWQSLRTGRA